MSTVKVLFVLMILVFAMPQMSEAVDITVDVDGTVLTGTDNVDICTTSYGGNFHIVAADESSTCPNSVTANDDNASDVMQLHNIRLVADVDAVTVSISFWANFASGPSGANAKYNLHTIGALYRSATKAAKNSIIDSYGYYKDPAGATSWTQIYHHNKRIRRERPKNKGEFDMGPAPAGGTQANPNSRELKGYVVVYLERAGDWLQLDEFAGIMAKIDDSTGPPGGVASTTTAQPCDCADVQSEPSKRPWKSIFDKYPWIKKQ